MYLAAQCVSGTSAKRVPVAVNAYVGPRFARSRKAAISSRVIARSGQ